MDEQTNFEGWAILEIFGHQTFAGYVKTEYFGTACMFRLDVPPLPERQRVTKSGLYAQTETDSRAWCPPGSTVKQPATEGYSKSFGVGAIYSMTHCTQEAALKAVEEIQPRPLMLVSLPPEKSLTAVEGFAGPIGGVAEFDCCGGNLADGHFDFCQSMNEDDDDDDLPNLH